MLTRRTNRLTRVWLVLAVLVAPIVVSAPPAFAAGTLTANPTTVYVKDASATGKTTLTWDGGPHGNVKIYVRAGGGQFAPTGLAGPSGSGDYTGLKLGETYEFRFFSSLNLLISTGPNATVTVKQLVRAETDLGCLVKCIREIGVTPGGTVADIHVETSSPAGVMVQASSDPPNANGSCKTTALASTVWKPQPAKVFDGRLTDLEPNTSYCLKVIAKDASGKEEATYRTFKTKNRHVTVIFETIKIISAGEDDGEWAFAFRVDTVKHDSFGQLSFMTGATVNLLTLVQTYKGKHNVKSLDIKVSGAEMDGLGGILFDGPSDAYVEQKLPIGGPGSYSTYNDGESFLGSFDFVSVPFPGSDDEAKFSVQGVFLVQYLP